MCSSNVHGFLIEGSACAQQTAITDSGSMRPSCHHRSRVDNGMSALSVVVPRTNHLTGKHGGSLLIEHGFGFQLFLGFVPSGHKSCLPDPQGSAPSLAIANSSASFLPLHPRWQVLSLVLLPVRICQFWCFVIASCPKPHVSFLPRRPSYLSCFPTTLSTAAHVYIII